MVLNENIPFRDGVLVYEILDPSLSADKLFKARVFDMKLVVACLNCLIR